MKKSVSEQLLSYLQENHGVFASGDLQRMEWRNRNGFLATPRSIVRRLEELAEEGKILVEYRGSHAHYSADPKSVTPKYKIIINETTRAAERVLVTN